MPSFDEDSPGGGVQLILRHHRAFDVSLGFSNKRSNEVTFLRRYNFDPKGMKGGGKKGEGRTLSPTPYI